MLHLDKQQALPPSPTMHGASTGRLQAGRVIIRWHASVALRPPKAPPPPNKRPRWTTYLCLQDLAVAYNARSRRFAHHLGENEHNQPPRRLCVWGGVCVHRIWGGRPRQTASQRDAGAFIFNVSDTDNARTQDLGSCEMMGLKYISKFDILLLRTCAPFPGRRMCSTAATDENNATVMWRLQDKNVALGTGVSLKCFDPAGGGSCLFSVGCSMTASKS